MSHKQAFSLNPSKSAYWQRRLFYYCSQHNYQQHHRWRLYIYDWW